MIIFKYLIVRSNLVTLKTLNSLKTLIDFAAFNAGMSKIKEIIVTLKKKQIEKRKNIYQCIKDIHSII